VAEKRVGIYIGSNAIGAAVTQGKDISLLTIFEFGAVADKSAEIANEDIRWEALVNKALREVGPNVKKVYVSLADKDFIFRSLELPLMSRKEIESSLDYEIEKYIPFKMEELEWDFEFVRFAKERKVSLSFIGIREANLRRVRDTFIRLGINVEAIEPSSLSLVRAIKSIKRFSKLKDFAILDLTSSESYLTFFQHDLPVFNRYLVMPTQDNSLNISRFNESVDLSFQYFKREFKSYKLDKCIVVGDISDANLLGTLKESLGTEVEAVGAYDIAKRNNATVGNIKAFGAAVRGYYPCAFASAFRKSAAAVSPGEKAPLRIPSLKVWLHGTILGIGLVGAFFLSIFMGQEVTVQKAKLFREEQNIQVPEALKLYSWKEREAQTIKRESEASALEKMVSSFESLTPFFERLSSRGVIPEGVWFERLDVRLSGDRNKKPVWTCSAQGYVYLDNDEAESQAIDTLLANLKKDMTIRRFFPNIALVNTRRADKDGYSLTSFSINLGRK